MGGGRKKSAAEKPGEAETCQRAGAGLATTKTGAAASRGALKRIVAAAKSFAGGACESPHCAKALGCSVGRALAKLICALALPAGLNQPILASTANSAARTQSRMPRAVSRECRIEKPPCIFTSLPFAEFWLNWRLRGTTC